MAKTNKELDEIKELTGAEESVCACKECTQMCHNAVCIGTPTDILNIVKAGFFRHLVMTIWRGGVKQNIPPIAMIQPYYDGERGCCTFMDVTGKHCTLHQQGLKPTEGRLQHHTQTLGQVMGVNLPAEHAVALTWSDLANKTVAMEIINELKAQGCVESPKKVAEEATELPPEN